MGEVIYLSERLADRTRASVGPAAFFYSLDCPLSYLVAERVERALGEVEWIPVVGPLSESSELLALDERTSLARARLAAAEHEARMLLMPMVEPQRYPMEGRRASRTAIWAARHGRGPTYALAVARLAFCGGFDIASDDVIAEGAAVAGLNPEHALEAARDFQLDYELEATAAGLQSRGISAPPAIRIGTRWFHGQDAITSAVAFSAAARVSSPRMPAS